MGLKQGGRASVWQVEPGRGNFTKVRLSTSRKNRQSGQYEQDFSGFCMFIGEAHKKAALLKMRDRIQVGEFEVSNRYDKATGKEYIDYKVFDFSVVESVGNQPGGSHDADNPVESNPAESDTDGLPF